MTKNKTKPNLFFKERNDDVDYPIGSLIKFPNYWVVDHWNSINNINNNEENNLDSKIGILIKKSNGLYAGIKEKRNNYLLYILFDGRLIKIPNYAAETI